MMKKMLIAFCVMLSVQSAFAADNLYSKHYKKQNHGDLKSMEAMPDTKIYVSNHYDDDNISMLERGYDMMGSSGFEAGSITPDSALQHAKEIKADVVLVYSKYASKRTSLSKLETIKEAARTTGEVDPALLEEDEEQYQYYASYWAKLPMPLLGLHVIKLKLKNKQGDYTPQDGLKVLAVIKDSPAYKAGIKRGDVLLDFANVKMEQPEQLSQVAVQHEGKPVEVVYQRGDMVATTKATLNHRQ